MSLLIKLLDIGFYAFVPLSNILKVHCKFNYLFSFINIKLLFFVILDQNNRYISNINKCISNKYLYYFINNSPHIHIKIHTVEIILT